MRDDIACAFWLSILERMDGLKLQDRFDTLRILREKIVEEELRLVALTRPGRDAAV